MPLTPTDKIWMDGELVPWQDATVHVLTHTMHYGSGVFEGIRAYPTSRGPAVFRLRDHIDRLFASAKILMIDVPYTVEDVLEAIRTLVRAERRDLTAWLLRSLGCRPYSIVPRAGPTRCAERTRDSARHEPEPSAPNEATGNMRSLREIQDRAERTQR